MASNIVVSDSHNASPRRTSRYTSRMSSDKDPSRLSSAGVLPQARQGGGPRDRDVGVRHRRDAPQLLAIGEHSYRTLVRSWGSTKPGQDHDEARRLRGLLARGIGLSRANLAIGTKVRASHLLRG
jgi:hypothetical protein